MKIRVKQLTLSFNSGKADDMTLYDWIRKQENSTAYIKSLIRDDMKNKGK